MELRWSLAFAAVVGLSLASCTTKEEPAPCTPSEERCDGADNDCDGEIDESGCATACTAGVDECADGKLRSCGADGLWGSFADCPSRACADATTCGPCTSDCSAGASECADGKLRSCLTDAHGCLAWGPETACADGACADATTCGSCANKCTAGANECADGKLRSCLTDAKGCLAWGPETACANGLCADARSCGGTPPRVVISELLYDSTGTPDTGAFVELAGPAGTSLEGLTLVGVNGNGGADYNAIALSGTIPSDGFFLVAHPSGPLAATADLAAASVDFQNGPDSVQLRQGTTVLDALAYDAFAAGDLFAGETAPAQEPPVDWSLARDAALSDSGNNATDFAPNGLPTPGARNCAAPCPAAGATECTDGQLRTCGTDASGCLAWSDFSACPQNQCADAVECAPPCEIDCFERECGNDGCGGTCGPCLAAESCSAAGQCECTGVDADADGHYRLGSCAAPADDCDDANPRVNPDQAELCNGKDDDCDGETDGLERACSLTGPCAAGTERCEAGDWGECTVAQPEICGNEVDDDCDGVVDEPGAVFETSPVVVATGTQPRLAALDDGFVAAWISSGQLFLQVLDSGGHPVGSPVQQPTTRSAYLVDLVRYAGGLGLAWAEENQDPASFATPTTTFARSYGTDLAPASAVHALPVSVNLAWFWTEELRVGTANAGASFVVAERVFVNERNPYSGAGRSYGQLYQTTVIPFVDAIFPQEYFFEATGSQRTGSQSMLSVAGLPDGYAVAWQPLSNGYPFDPVQLIAFDSDRRPRWGPVGGDPYAWFANAIVFDGTRILAMSYEHLSNRWANSTFDPATGLRSATVGSDATTTHAWYSADATHLGAYSAQLLESSTGNLNLARFDSTGALLERPTSVMPRTSGSCQGQCARMATNPQQLGVLYSDEGEIRFQRFCR